MAMVRDLLNEQRTFTSGHGKDPGKHGSEGSQNNSKLPTFLTQSGQRGRSPAHDKANDKTTPVGKDKTDDSDARSDVSIVQSMMQKWKSTFKREGEQNTPSSGNDQRQEKAKESDANDKQSLWNIPSLSYFGARLQGNAKKPEEDTKQKREAGKQDNLTDKESEVGSPKQVTQLNTSPQQQKQPKQSTSKVSGGGNVGKSKIPKLQAQMRSTSISSESDRDSITVNEHKARIHEIKAGPLSDLRGKKTDKEIMAASYMKLKANSENNKIRRSVFNQWKDNVKDGNQQNRQKIVAKLRQNVSHDSDQSARKNSRNQWKDVRTSLESTRDDKKLQKIGLLSLRLYARQQKLLRKTLKEWRNQVIQNKMSGKLFHSDDATILRQGIGVLKDNANHYKLLRSVFTSWRKETLKSKVTQKLFKSNKSLLRLGFQAIRQNADDRRLLRKVFKDWSSIANGIKSHQSLRADDDAKYLLQCLRGLRKYAEDRVLLRQGLHSWRNVVKDEQKKKRELMKIRDEDTTSTISGSEQGDQITSEDRELLSQALRSWKTQARRNRLLKNVLETRGDNDSDSETESHGEVDKFKQLLEGQQRARVFRAWKKIAAKNRIMRNLLDASQNDSSSDDGTKKENIAEMDHTNSMKRALTERIRIRGRISDSDDTASETSLSKAGKIDDDDRRLLTDAFRKLQINAKDARLLRGTLSGLHTHSEDNKLLRLSVRKLKSNSLEVKLKRKGLEGLKCHVKESRCKQHALHKLHAFAQNRKLLRQVLLEWKGVCSDQGKKKDKKIVQESPVMAKKIRVAFQSSPDKNLITEAKVANIRQMFEPLSKEAYNDQSATDSYGKEDDADSSDDVSSISTIIDTRSSYRKDVLKRGLKALKQNVEDSKLLSQVLKEWNKVASSNKKGKNLRTSKQQALNLMLSESSRLSKHKTKYHDTTSSSDDTNSEDEDRWMAFHRQLVLKPAFEKLKKNTEEQSLQRRVFKEWKSLSLENIVDSAEAEGKDKFDSWPRTKSKKGTSSRNKDSTPNHSKGELHRSKPLQNISKPRSRRNKQKRKEPSLSGSELSEDPRSPSWISNIKNRFQRVFHDSPSTFRRKSNQQKNDGEDDDDDSVELQNIYSPSSIRDQEHVDKGDINFAFECTDDNEAGGPNENRQRCNKDVSKMKDKESFGYENRALSDSSIEQEKMSGLTSEHRVKTNDSRSIQKKSSPETEKDLTLQQKDLDCPVCGRIFKCPVLLRCAHTLCKDCVTVLVETSVNNSFECPLCKAVTRLSDNDEELFCPNFFVLKELNKLQRDLEERSCFSCKEPAEIFCETCGDLLCKECSLAHKKVRFTMDHNLIPMSLYKDPSNDSKEYFCSKHPREKLTQYCTLCDISLCEECAVAEHVGSKHDVKSVDVAGITAREELRELTADMSSRQAELQLAVKDVDRVKSALEDQVNYVKNEIKESFDRITQILGERIKELFNQVQDVHDNKVSRLDAQRAKIQQRVVQLRNTKDFMEQLKSHDNNIEMMQMKTTLMGTIHDIEPVESLEPQVEKDAFFFQSNEKVIKTEINKHGQIKHVGNEAGDGDNSTDAHSSSSSINNDKNPKNVSNRGLGFNKPRETSESKADSTSGSEVHLHTDTDGSQTHVPVSPELLSHRSHPSPSKKILTMDEVAAMIRQDKDQSASGNSGDASVDTTKSGQEATKTADVKLLTVPPRDDADNRSNESNQTSVDTNPYIHRSPGKSLVTQLLSGRGEQVNVLKFGVLDHKSKSREVEVKLTSPDKSIVSAHINENENGTFTIFCCPRIDDDFNLFVSVGGTNFKKEKKVLNFFGTFATLNKKEIDLACRTIGLLRWHFTPGLLERKHGKVVPGRTFKIQE